MASPHHQRSITGRNRPKPTAPASCDTSTATASAHARKSPQPRPHPSSHHQNHRTTHRSARHRRNRRPRRQEKRRSIGLALDTAHIPHHRREVRPLSRTNRRLRPHRQPIQPHVHSPTSATTPSAKPSPPCTVTIEQPAARRPPPSWPIGMAVPGPYLRNNGHTAVVSSMQAGAPSTSSTNSPTAFTVPVFIEQDARAGVLANSLFDPNSNGEPNLAYYLVGEA